MSDLPRFRKSVLLRFNGLRMCAGEGCGVIFDVDTPVERECYRVKTEDDWKWQIKGINRLPAWDRYLAEGDQICLDDIGSDTELFEVIDEK